MAEMEDGRKFKVRLSSESRLKCGDWCSEDLNMFICQKTQSRDNREEHRS